MSNRKEIKVPDIGDFDKVPVIEVLVAEGDVIEKEQSLVTLESDKATMEVPSSLAGKLVELNVKEGDEVAEGDVLGVVEVEDAGGDEAGGDETDESDADQASGEEERQQADEQQAGEEKESEKETGQKEEKEEKEEKQKDREAEDREREQKPTSKKEPRKESKKGPAGGDEISVPPVPFAEMDRDPSSIPHASPAVRKLARELGADLEAVEGSGSHGRITADDLKKHVKSRLESGAQTPAAPSGAGLDIAELPDVDFSKFGEIEEQKLSRIQRISGPVLHRNWVTIPHVTQFDEADITEMEAFRKASKQDAEEAGTKMTPLVFLIKAVVAGLKKYPDFNASLTPDRQSLIYKKYFHVGVAVDTPNGLMVPVIRDADRKSLLELAQDLGELSGKARDGKISREEMQGGCMSISSLGGIGGTAFTPIINAPEVAILGVSRAEMKPVWNGQEFQPRLMLPLSLSYDHRVIDGAQAARFTQYLAHVLGDVRRMML
ncbi:MAG: dihydrolipoyllysine-residue acetyltransferase [Wenzhouxiangellaceae bacterium]|nr:dihydrolipoyllysine-residue acetyltransferase [Wenzhouxiangellaceae bacterium]